MQLVLYPHPILRKRAAPIQTVDATVLQRAREMFEVMYQESGVGLAAPQVGWSARLFVMNALGEEHASGERLYINPEVVVPEGDVEELSDEEGCLSIPDVRGKVIRHQRILVRALDAEGKPFDEEVTDLPARVIQHELDHLDGILFITRLNTSDRMLAGKTLKRLEKEYKESLRAKG
jgi:peptide deformylase